MDDIKHETLGDNVAPLRYELEIEPDFSTFKYDGNEKIHAVVNNATKRILLNATELEIKQAKVKDSRRVQDARVSFDKRRERLILDLKRSVKGRIEILVQFEGVNNDGLYGFYRSRYTVGKSRRYMLTTQFEAANARNAFPCFDEPGYKAVFDLSLRVKKELNCISNMPVRQEREIGDGKKVVTFQTTPKMSSYLLYIGVGEFKRISKRHNGIDFGVITPPGKEKYASLALDYGIRFLSFFERYFGIRYPLPKLDLIAVPDFSAGAMENWGAITFRETALLGDENSSIMAKQRIAEVIAHELVHQWFGDLVTMKWWNDLWLNESFATFMSFKAVDSVFPEWEMMTQYIANTVGVAFAADQLASTHPISVDVKTPHEVDQIFDEISYNKGGAVLNMLEGYVGRETFRKGLNHYLKTHSYSNSTKYDLWGAIDSIAKREGKKLSLPEVARSWIDNKGYPAIEIRRVPEGFEMIQNRFMLLNDKKESTLWPVPVSYAYPPRREQFRLLMKERRKRITHNGRGQVKLNYGQSGLFRTVYPKDMLESLGELIKSNELGWLDAWGVENDLYALTKKTAYKLTDYIDFVDRYCFAAKYPLNASVLSHLRGLFGLLYTSRSDVLEELRRLLNDYSSEIIKEVGWKRTEGEASTTTMMRSAAILSSGMSGDKMTINKAVKMFNSGSAMDNNLRGAVYGLVAWSGNKRTYEELESRYRKAELPEEKIKLLNSLAMFSDTGLLNKALAYSLSKNVRYQDSFSIPAYIASNPVGRDIIWGWTRKNWHVLMKRFKSGTHMLSRYIDNLDSLYEKKTIDEVRRFFNSKKNSREDITKALRETLEVMEINARFVYHNMHNDREE